MQKNRGTSVLGLLAASAVTGVLAAGPDEPAGISVQFAEDPSGVLGIVNLNGRRRSNNPFFQSLGTNGRSCSTCHLAEQAFSFSAGNARERFERSEGRDPLFAPVDGANCPSAQPGDRAGRSLLLQNGLIRVAQKLPADAQFTISVVQRQMRPKRPGAFGTSSE